MKKFFVLFSLVSVSVLSAVPLCSGPTDVLSSGFSCAIDGVVFSNFSVTAATPGVNPSMTLVTANVVDDVVNLSFNPSLSAPAGTSADIWFYFTVTGGINGIDLTTSGTGSTITEYACSSPLVNNICPQGTQLATLTVGSGETGLAMFADGQFYDTVYIFKNILVEGGVTTRSELSSFTQSFHVPEPVAFVLMGSGLLAIGLVRRIRRS